MRCQDLKRRKTIGYKIKLWFLTITFQDIIHIIKIIFSWAFEFVIMGLALILLFIIPHFFH
jgi:hypothetical protein